MGGSTPHYQQRRTIAALLAVTLLIVIIVSGGCAFLFTRTFCDKPGNCGQSGNLLRSFEFSISEFSSAAGEGGFLSPPQGRVFGLAFAETAAGLRLYVGTEDGLLVYDGHPQTGLFEPSHPQPLTTILVPDCESMGDVVVLHGGDVVAVCSQENRLVRIDPVMEDIVSSFSCCDPADDSFDPFALALAPDGTILAGTTAIYAVNAETGDLTGVVIQAGVGGSTTYDDFVFGPNGNLFVSANPDVGILEFDGETFDFLGVFVADNDNGMPIPRALAFGPNGNLFAGSLVGTLLREFAGQTGELVEELVGENGPANLISFMAFRP